MEIRQFFFIIVEESDSVTVTEENKKALIFIAGYVARGAVKNCAECKTKLSICHEMEVETADNALKSCLSQLDRGGLFGPNDASISIRESVFKIFQLSISDKFETEFLNVTNQKSLLVEMAIEKLQDFISTDSSVCSYCNKTFKDLVVHCAKTMANILLSNYCKKSNDKIKSKDQCKKRKLMILK